MDDAFISDRGAIDVQRVPTGNKGGWLVLAALAIAGVVVGAYNWIVSLIG